jgi:glycosyltransferase involved in cell wall biosynthesis
MRVFKPGDKQEGRVANNLPAGKRIILFVSQRATNVNKGMDYLVEACRLLAEQYPEMKENTAVAVLGGHADEVIEQLPFEAIPLGYVSDTKRIVELYHAADVFVLPSLKERFKVMSKHYGLIPTVIMHLWFVIRQAIK